MSMNKVKLNPPTGWKPIFVEPLDEKLKEYKRQLAEAEWEDNWQEIKYLERAIADVKYRISLGEKYDMPF